jgi:cold shock CspA family protein/ribosome-associated translation inhibitor RaiA
MILQPHITFRNMESDPKLEKAIAKEITTLERFFARLMTCRVVVEAPRRANGLHRVRIEAVAPKKNVVVDHTPSLHGVLRSTGEEKKTKKSEPARSHRNPERAIHEAFQEMRRRLQDHAQRLELKVKQHGESDVARVLRIYPGEDYGYLETPDGQQIYFHRNSVLGGHFDQLREGAKVHFAVENGEKGPQASTVELIRPAKQVRKAAASKTLPRKKRVRRANA